MEVVDPPPSEVPPTASNQHPDDDSDSDFDADPQIVGEGPRARKRRPVKPRGRDYMAHKYSDYTNALLVPVSICMLVVVWAVRNFTPLYRDQHAQAIPMVVTEQANDSPAQKVEGGVINALVVVIMLVVITFLMVLLYKLRCTKVIFGWLMLSSAIILFVMTWMWLDLFCVKFQIPYEKMSVSLVLWNFGIVGIMSIFFYAHPRMTQAYLVAVSAIMGWSLTRIPEWTTWVLLASVALYDVAAVLTPKGPLRMLVEESQRRNEPLPGFVYESKSFKLGLGDFVFYSVLVGRAAVFSYLTWTVCFLAILFGLCATLFCLGVFQKALPALPISIALGILFYFLTRFVMLPFTEEMMMSGIWI
jgi:presenilin 1